MICVHFLFVCSHCMQPYWTNSHLTLVILCILCLEAKARFVTLFLSFWCQILYCAHRCLFETHWSGRLPFQLDFSCNYNLILQTFGSGDHILAAGCLNPVSVEYQYMSMPSCTAVHCCMAAVYSAYYMLTVQCCRQSVHQYCIGYSSC